MKIRSWFIITCSFGMGIGAGAQQSSTAPAVAQQTSPSVPAQVAPPDSSGREGRPRGDRGGWMGGPGGARGVLGVVTEAAADHYAIKIDTGEVYTIHFSVNTRILKAPAGSRPQNGRGEGDGSQRLPPESIKPSEIKAGDWITASGEVDAAKKSIGAVFILQLDPERAKQAREMQANYGKTWVAGKVTAIDGVKVTLQGAVDNASHSFIADENTTFRKRRDPITLADIAVGDNLRVEGAVKDGVFVAASVLAMGAPRGEQGPPPTLAPSK